MTTTVRIGNVWDSTTEVLGGRTGVIASVAGMSLFLPGVVQSAVALFLPETPLRALVGGLVGLAAALLSLWGALAIMALATDPSTDRASAQRQATARLGPLIGVSLVLLLIFVLLFVPVFVVLGATGYDFQAASAAMAANAPALLPHIAAGAGLFLFLYTIVLVILAFWVSARLMLVNPVILNERLGLGAIRRSIALTRGLTWKLIGVAILFTIVVSIATLAAQAIVGVVFRLVLGAENIATSLFLAGVAGALVSTALIALAYVFIARLYVATRDRPTA